MAKMYNTYKLGGKKRKYGSFARGLDKVIEKYKNDPEKKKKIKEAMKKAGKKMRKSGYPAGYKKGGSGKVMTNKELDEYRKKKKKKYKRA